MDCRAFQAFQLRVGLLCLTFVLSILESSRRAVHSLGGTAGRNGVSQIGEECLRAPCMRRTLHTHSMHLSAVCSL